MICEGLVDLGIAGAAEASLNWGATRAWQAMRVLSPDGLWPFAKRRNGTVLAEGAGILMLEEYERAKERGAPILAELMGYGMTADAADMVNPSIDGASMAMQMALDDAGFREPPRVRECARYGTTVNDINETNAIKRVFGDAANKVSISSTKSMHGHCLGAGGGIEAVAAIKAMAKVLCRRQSASMNRTPNATSTTPRMSARRATSTTRCQTPSPLAALTRSWSSARRPPKATSEALFRPRCHAGHPCSAVRSLCVAEHAVHAAVRPRRSAIHFEAPSAVPDVPDASSVFIAMRRLRRRQLGEDRFQWKKGHAGAASMAVVVGGFSEALLLALPCEQACILLIRQCRFSADDIPNITVIKELPQIANSEYSGGESAPRPHVSVSVK